MKENVMIKRKIS